jgi:L-serine kinase (ADP)
MTGPAEYALLPISELRAHEQIEESNVVDLVELIRRTQVVADPIWVARGSLVILNGHHRVEALRRVGAERVPAWVLDYDSDLVHLERWHPGPPIAKKEVIRRAQEGRLYPPKTTRHRLLLDLPARPTRLADLLSASAGPAQPRAPGRS